ncbi:MAG TPA: hypothetical protein VN363_04390, partial [Anaerolineales bacterium]|nr:hypothetical protein [Anaerolineales bacterium]
MKPLHYFLLYLLAFLVLLGAASFQHSPGYMDAEYYLAGGMSITSGSWQEPFIWNYLDDPVGLPHPAFAYWMPLASLLAAAGMKLGGSLSFTAGRLGFILVGAGVAPLTAALAYRLDPRRTAALLAGLLAVCAGYYLPYLPAPDTFGLVMLLGGGFLFLCQLLGERSKSRANQPSLESPSGESPRWQDLAMVIGLGVIAGFMHLARADGLLWLAAGGLAVLILPGSAWPRRLAHLGLLVLGYLVVMAPWMARNQAVFGSFFSAGGLRPLWITTYNELYTYPASLLTPQRWLASGLPALLAVRLKALGVNLQSLLAVQGQIFLLPLMLVGLWQLRRAWAVRLGGLAWLAILGVMSLVFPHQGWRGGYFHSAAALQPLLWAVVPLGLSTFINWAGAERRWNIPQAQRVFQVGLLVLAAGFSLVVSGGRIFGASPQNPGDSLLWDAPARRYERMGAALEAQGLP